MRSERQNDEFGQALPDRVAFRAAQFDGRANKFSATLRIDNKPVGPPARIKQQSRFLQLQIGLAGLQNRKHACLEDMEMSDVAELRHLAKFAGEEASRARSDVAKKGGKRIHWDDRQSYWHQTLLVVLHIGDV
jgi:hypothetical protein